MHLRALAWCMHALSDLCAKPGSIRWGLLALRQIKLGSVMHHHHQVHFHAVAQYLGHPQQQAQHCGSWCPAWCAFA